MTFSALLNEVYFIFYWLFQIFDSFKAKMPFFQHKSFLVLAPWRKIIAQNVKLYKIFGHPRNILILLFFSPLLTWKIRVFFTICSIKFENLFFFSIKQELNATQKHTFFGEDHQTLIILIFCPQSEKTGLEGRVSWVATKFLEF